MRLEMSERRVTVRASSHDLLGGMLQHWEDGALIIKVLRLSCDSRVRASITNLTDSLCPVGIVRPPQSPWLIGWDGSVRVLMHRCAVVRVIYRRFHRNYSTI